MRRTVLFLGFLIVACGLTAAPNPEDMLPFIPPQAQTVLALDSAALRAHPAVQRFLQERAGRWAGADQEIQAFLQEAGLDPLTDVDAVVLALIADGPHPQGVMLVAGSFSPDRIAAAVTARGAIPFDLAGHTAYRLPGEGAAAPEAPVFVLVSPELAVLGDPHSVAGAVHPRTRASGIVEAEVAAGRLDLNTPFWLVTLVPMGSRTVAGEGWSGTAQGGATPLAGVERAATAVQRAGLFGSLGSTLHLHGWALTDTAENAELLRDAARGALAAMRLHATGSRPEIMEVLRGIDIRMRGDMVSFAAEFPLDFLERLSPDR
jgi:hypothetical protein